MLGRQDYRTSCLGCMCVVGQQICWARKNVRLGTPHKSIPVCVLPGIIILRVMVVNGWTWTANVLGEKNSGLGTPYKRHYSVCSGQDNLTLYNYIYIMH